MSLEIGSLTLTPTFDEDTLEYAAATSNTSDTIEAVPEVLGVVVSIEVNGEAHENGEAATWVAGENEVIITVTNAANVKEYEVTVTYTPPDGTLASLTIGTLTLDPTFDKDTTDYAATATNASDTITATATDAENAEIEILNGETEVTNGEAATWATGENVVTITVTNGATVVVYTVTVTKGE